MSKRSLLAIAVLLSLALVIEYSFLALCFVCYGHGGAQASSVKRPTIYDTQAHKLVIDEGAGRSWLEYTDGSVKELE